MHEDRVERESISSQACNKILKVLMASIDEVSK